MSSITRGSVKKYNRGIPSGGNPGVNPVVKRSVLNDDEMVDGYEQGPLGFFVKVNQQHLFMVSLDEPFLEPKHYRNVVAMMLEAKEEDTVMFLINSPGGLMDGLLTLLDAIKQTDATTVAVLVGQVSSAASMLALHCDEVEVSDNSTMLCHNISYGTGGKGADVLSHVKHVSKTSDKLLRSTYKDFLSTQEIDDMISGKEIYLDADEIQDRLDAREDSRQSSFSDSMENLLSQGYTLQDVGVSKDGQPMKRLVPPCPDFEGDPNDGAFIKPSTSPKALKAPLKTKSKKV